jgi:hypothetical protein
VRLRRLRAGEWLAAAGAVALTALLFLDWFEYETRAPRAEGLGGSGGILNTLDTFGPAPSTTGWSILGWPVVAALVVVIGLAVWLVAATAGDAAVSQPVMAAALLSALGPVVLLVVALRVTVAQPGPDEVIAVQPAAYLGLAALAAVVAGAWRAIADERTGAPESAYTPPPARPAPPERI